MSRRWSVALVVAAALPLSPAAAQVRAALDASTRLDPRPGPDRTGLWLGFDVGIERPAWAVTIRGAGVPGDRSGRFESRIDGSLGRRLDRHTSLTARFTGVLERPLGVVTDAEAGARLGVERRRGLWRAALGLRGGANGRPGQRLFAGGYAQAAWQMGGFTITGELGRVVNLDGALGSSLAPSGPLADTLAGRSPGSARAFTHMGLGVGWRYDALTARARVLHRSRMAGHAGFGWETALAVEAVPGLRLHAGVGHAPSADGVFLPYRRQLSFGIELSRRAPRGPEHGSAALPRFALVPRDADTWAITVRHASASRVEVVGDFTDWRPVRLSRSSRGAWQLVLPLRPGVHHMNVRFDGGPWVVPDGLPAAEDGFGGRVGVLFVADASRD